MTAYLTVAQFKTRSTIPPGYVDEIETVQSGWTLAQLEQESRWIDSRLRKRYAVPFATCPEIVAVWLVRLVTIRVWQRRGYDPTDQSIERALEDERTAREEVKEAADSKDGLFDLPLNDQTTSSGISKAAPFYYSEQSPYVWADSQGSTGKTEDSNGSGSSA